MVIEQDRYVAVAKDRILCVKGWILMNNLRTNQVKLFPTPSHIEQYFEVCRKSCGRPKYEAKKVKVQIEVLDYES